VVDGLSVVADPSDSARGRTAGLLLVAAALLAVCGGLAVAVSPVERVAPAAARTATETGSERVVEASPTTTAAPQPTVAPSTTVAPPPAEIDDGYEVRVDEGIIYGSGATATGSIELALDLFVPVDAAGVDRIEGQPAAVIIHGGGFTQGSRADADVSRLASTLAAHGIVTVSIDHRLAGDQPVVTSPELVAYLDGLDPTTVDEWLAGTDVVVAAVEDAILAATWLLDLGVDPDRLVVGGSSAGAVTSLYAAHLRDDAALDAPEVAAVVSLWGGYTLTPGLAEPLDASDAPMWIVHGTDDPIVPFDYASVLVWKAAGVGVDVVAHGLEGRGHGPTEIDLWTDRTEAGAVLIDDLIDFLQIHV
jgi:acetyl esterase/lipase